jgi:hypothetical protein
VARLAARLAARCSRTGAQSRSQTGLIGALTSICVGRRSPCGGVRPRRGIVRGLSPAYMHGDPDGILLSGRLGQTWACSMSCLHAHGHANFTLIILNDLAWRGRWDVAEACLLLMDVYAPEFEQISVFLRHYARLCKLCI